MTKQKSKATSNPSPRPQTPRQGVQYMEDRQLAYENANGNKTALIQLGDTVDALTCQAGGLAYLLGQIYLEAGHTLAPALQSALKFSINSLKDEEAKLQNILPRAKDCAFYVISEIEEI